MTPEQRHAYATETHRMALELEDFIFPPWRWRRWFTQAREVKRRIAVLKLDRLKDAWRTR